MSKEVNEMSSAPEERDVYSYSHPPRNPTPEERNVRQWTNHSEQTFRSYGASEKNPGTAAYRHCVPPGLVWRWQKRSRRYRTLEGLFFEVRKENLYQEKTIMEGFNLLRRILVIAVILIAVSPASAFDESSSSRDVGMPDVTRSSFVFDRSGVQPLWSLDNKPTLYLVSNSHIDTQWNWTVQDTIREYVPRTFFDNFKLFEQFPNYKFNFEGVIHYMFFKEYHPEAWPILQDYVARGRWKLAGSWINAIDPNVPSSESLMRQALYGKRFFRREFGA